MKEWGHYVGPNRHYLFCSYLFTRQPSYLLLGINFFTKKNVIASMLQFFIFLKTFSCQGVIAMVSIQ